jgi:pimeloyl-ACP methyl ester carboxylesterase
MSIMRRLNQFLSIIFALFCVTSFAPAWSSDLAKERRWADQIIDQLFDGEAVWLTGDGADFLGLYTEAATAPKGGVIVLHGIGVHPDWPQVINPLRVGLAEEGWNTLSVQMPILPNEAEQEEYRPLYVEVPPRIDAAIQFLKEQEASPVFIIGHSIGVSMAMHYLGSNSNNRVAGLVAIGTNMGGIGSLDEKATWLSRVQLPVLDLYGEFDLDVVLGGVGTRASVAQSATIDDFTQIEVPGSDHFFDGYEQQLLDVVSAWLEERR